MASHPQIGRLDPYEPDVVAQGAAAEGHRRIAPGIDGRRKIDDVRKDALQRLDVLLDAELLKLAADPPL
ncbi:MAG: hypothetical protein AAB262_00280, partial [Elusimicrobiota bacterium]